MKELFCSDRIRFVQVSTDLVKDYLLMINDKDVTKYIRRRTEPLTKEDEIRWVGEKLAKNDCVFSMIEKKSGEFIGNVELMERTEEEKELGIIITAKKQNAGFGKEAVTALTQFGFDRFGLKRIVLQVNPENARAIHVYLSCGFREYDRTDDTVFMEIAKDAGHCSEKEFEK